MKALDTLRYAGQAAASAPLRAALMMLAMAVGVASVVVLTALGDGARRYVVNEFSALGARLLIVMPGRTETGGIGAGAFITSTPRPLTLEDASALTRLPQLEYVAPLIMGSSELAANGRLRETLVLGSSASYGDLRELVLAEGEFLPAGDITRGAAVAVLGQTLSQELFDGHDALGKMVRVGDARLRIIGVLASTSHSLGMSPDELLIVPAATAQAIFNTDELFRIFAQARSRDDLAATRQAIEERLQARRGGTPDFTVVAQDSLLGTLDRILGALTLAVAGIAGISLIVAGILVMNVMLVAVSQRTHEIGLLKALGARAATIRTNFLVEAALLSCAGAAAGLALGHLAAWGLRLLYPQLPAWPPDWAVLAALITALGTGLLFGVMPARRAARLDPVAALAGR